MDPKIHTQFLDLACQLSPENLTCDGELPPAQVKRRQKILVSKWLKLEKQIGRSVSEEEIWKTETEIDYRYGL